MYRCQCLPICTMLFVTFVCLLTTVTGMTVGYNNANGESSDLYTTVVTDIVTVNEYTTGSDDVCRQEKHLGSGRFTYPKWYYDSSEEICKRFNYRGSGGNGNCFGTYAECSTICKSRCYQPIPSSHNDTCDGGGFEWAYNPGRGKCLPFRNSSCSSSTNRFATKRECEHDCIHYGEDTPPQQHVCLPPNTRTSVCNEEFVVSGKVSSIFHEIYSDDLVHRLVVEVSEVFKGRSLLPLYSVNNTDGSSAEFVHIKKILIEGGNCYDVNKAITYVFMGSTQYSNAILDNSSYVQEERTSVLMKVNRYINSCSS